MPPRASQESTATLGLYGRVIRPLDERIRAEVRRSGAVQWIVETDYALGHVLAAIGTHTLLGQTLVFKGGTALKKIYIESYRFSLDLDFSTMGASRTPGITIC